MNDFLLSRVEYYLRYHFFFFFLIIGNQSQTRLFTMYCVSHDATLETKESFDKHSLMSLHPKENNVVTGLIYLHSTTQCCPCINLKQITSDFGLWAGGSLGFNASAMVINGTSFVIFRWAFDGLNEDPITWDTYVSKVMSLSLIICIEL